MPTLLDGKYVAQLIRSSLAEKVADLLAQGHPAPHLAIILVGEDLPSHTYVHHKLKACQEVGIKTTLLSQAADTQQHTLLQLIQSLNEDNTIHGIIVQLPLPQHIVAKEIINAIYPLKDVDGLHPLNYGKMAYQLPTHIPATPLGILMLLAYYKIKTDGKHCVIIGRGPTVGAPLSILMTRDTYPGNATVTLCHSHTRNLASLTRQADILVVAAGKPGLITAAMVQPGAVVIDVGITRVPDPTKKLGYKLQGDVDFENVSPLCEYITPVPGGIGPMTIAALLENTLRAATNQVYL